MDALSRILETVRLRSSILSRAELSAPWGVSTTGVRGGAVFHAVLRGRALLRAGKEAIALPQGSVVVLPTGGAHELSDPPGAPVVPLGTLPATDEGGIPVVRYGRRGGEHTRILCGRFQLDHAAADAFLALLPPVLAAGPGEGRSTGVAQDPASGASAWIAQTLVLLDEELAAGKDGANAMVTRLCDVLFVQLLRVAAVGEPRGWLAALFDPQIGRALALIHEDPKTRWDSAVLAERVGVSRSRFFARFTELVGEPPAQYLSRWRIHVAADTLRKRPLSTAELAEMAGYASEDAFARVFKRHIGMTPSEYRRSLRPAGDQSTKLEPGERLGSA